MRGPTSTNTGTAPTQPPPLPSQGMRNLRRTPRHPARFPAPSASARAHRCRSRTRRSGTRRTIPLSHSSYNEPTEPNEKDPPIPQSTGPRYQLPPPLIDSLLPRSRRHLGARSSRGLRDAGRCRSTGRLRHARGRRHARNSRHCGFRQSLAALLACGSIGGVRGPTSRARLIGFHRGGSETHSFSPSLISARPTLRPQYHLSGRSRRKDSTPTARAPHHPARPQCARHSGRGRT